MTTRPAPLELDVDLVELGDVIRVPGERRRYRVAGVRTIALIPTRAQEAELDVDDRRRLELELRPVSRGGSSHRRTFRPSDRVLVDA